MIVLTPADEAATMRLHPGVREVPRPQGSALQVSLERRPRLLWMGYGVSWWIAWDGQILTDLWSPTYCRSVTI